MRRAPASLSNIFRLGVKELWSLLRDPAMLVLIAYTFTLSIYVAATAMPESLHNAAIAIVDNDGSPSRHALRPCSIRRISRWPGW